MVKYFENRIRNEQIMKCVRALGDSGIGVLKEVLRKQFSHEIEWAVWHRISERYKIGNENIPDKIRKSLRNKWDAMCCPVCGNYMCYDISEECIVEVEHIIERGLGGSNEPSNLVPCCNDCNRSLGNVFNVYVLQAKEKRILSQQEWVVLIGDWVVFKQLLYCDRDLAFWLFEKFHRQFVRYKNGSIERKERHGNFDWLINRTIISERIEEAVKELEKRVVRKEFEMKHGLPPKILDMSAYARTYRNRLKNYMNEVLS